MAMVVFQLDILIQYTILDPRIQVKYGALKNLRDLAKTGPHLWTEKHVEVSGLVVCTSFVLFLISSEKYLYLIIMNRWRL